MDFKTLKGKKRVSLTLDKDLLKKMEEIQDKEKIISLSALINNILWEELEKK